MAKWIKTKPSGSFRRFSSSRYVDVIREINRGIINSGVGYTANWGSINGNILDQTDLQNSLNDKVDKELLTVTKEPTGFPNRTDSTFSFDDLTRTFTIQPTGASFDIWKQGNKITINSPVSIQIPDITEKYFIYFDNSVLGYSINFSDSLLNDKVFVATVYWNQPSQYSVFVVDERHGLTMDWATHFHLHNSFGTRYYGGFSLGYEETPTGTLNSDSQIQLTGGTIADEDIPTTIIDSVSPSAFFEQTLSPVAQLPVFYRQGLPFYWEKESATNYPYVTVSNIPQYNDTSYGLSNVPDGEYFAYWIFATPEVNNPVIAIPGNRTDATLNSAKELNDYASIEWSELPTQEFKVLYRIIFHYDTGAYTNDNNTVIAHVEDLRGTIDTTLINTSAASANDHGALLGLADDDHVQYYNTSRINAWLAGKTTSDLTEGANQYFTNERAQDAVGTIFTNTSTINLTYNDALNTISASVNQSAIDHGSISGLSDDDHAQYHTDARADLRYLENGVLKNALMPQVIIEDFVGGSSVLLGLSVASASGGSSSTEVPEQQANWNGLISYPRFGQVSCRINTASSSRSTLSSPVNFRLYPQARFKISFEFSIVGGQIDFANDPVLLCIGFIDNFAVTNPTNGFYMRPPRTGETNFLKYVIRIASAESVFDTTIPYDSTNRRFINCSIEWDGTNMIFTGKDDSITSINTVSNFLTTYPTLSTLNFAYGGYNGRNGNPIVGVSRNLNIDKITQYIKNNY